MCAMKTRYRPAEIALISSARDEIMLYANDPYLWVIHCCGKKLDPHQLVFFKCFYEYANCLLIGSRRIRKSFAVAMFFLMEAATKPNAEINIHSPTMEQSKRNLAYMTEVIINSPILSNYLETRLREGIGMEYIHFANGSKIQAKGQATSIDGLGATHQWWEEVDDMDRENLMTRIFPTGSQIKDDFEYGEIKGCKRIATGTIKKKGNIHWLEHPEKDTPVRFFVLPKIDAYVGIEYGIIPEEDINMARDILMTGPQFARTYLCLYTESTEYYATSMIEICKDFDLFPVPPRSGEKFKTKGDVTFGMDFEAQGDGEDASITTITFLEQVQDGLNRWLWSMSWPSGTSPSVVEREVVDMCRYFKPKAGIGCAYDVTQIYNINKKLYKFGVTKINVDKFENKAGSNGWDKWFFRPLRFNAKPKHDMFKKLQNKMRTGFLKWPIPIEGHELYYHLVRTINQLENIQAKHSKQGYDSFSMIRKIIGDDYVDSLVAALFAQEEKEKSASAWGSSVKSSKFKNDRKFAGQRFRR